MSAALSLVLALLASQAPESAGVAAWDTGEASGELLNAEKISAKAGWIAIPRDQTGASPKGDAVVTNGRILAVARRKDWAVEVYAVTAGRAVERVRLVLQGPGGDAAVRLERL